MARRTTVRAFLFTILAALAPVAVAYAYAAAKVVAPPPARRAELLYLLRQDCGACHGMTLKGGLGPALLPERLAAIDDDVLIATVLDGRPGTPMPPWRFMISPDEAAWLVHRLKKGIEGDD